MIEKTTKNEIELFRIGLIKNQQKEGVRFSYKKVEKPSIREGHDKLTEDQLIEFNYQLGVHDEAF